MTEQEQINALAELDGWHRVYRDSDQAWARGADRKLGEVEYMFPDYLNSYDAIIPLIQKIAHQSVLHEILWISATPAQLCEALLRATKKWKE